MSTLPMPERPDDIENEPLAAIDGPPSGDKREWWTATVDAYLTPLYRFIRVRVPQDVVEDLVQDVFVAAAGGLGQFDPKRGTVWQWLLGIARNTIAQHYRHDRSASTLGAGLAWIAAGDGQLERAILAESPLPDEMCQREEFRVLARAALSTLEPRHRECLIGRYYEDLSLAELSQRLNLSSSAVNSLLYRARRELRAAFLSLVDETTFTEEHGP